MLDYKKMAMDSLESTLMTIAQSYEKVYDMAKDTENSDAEWVMDLTNILINVSAVLEVYTRDDYIHPSYALEKIRKIQGRCDQHIRYWERNMEE